MIQYAEVEFKIVADFLDGGVFEDGSEPLEQTMNFGLLMGEWNIVAGVRC